MNEFAWILFKSLFGFVLLMFVSRLIGRKILSQMTYFDFVTAIVIGNMAGSYVTENHQGLALTLGIVFFALFSVLTSYTTILSLPARKIIEGEPVIIIQNGKILENNMLKVKYNLDDLEMQLRNKDVFDITTVEFAVLEANGQLSVLKKSQNLPLTPKDLQRKTQYQGVSTEIIKDGVVLEENLKQNNLTFGWLYNKLREQQIKDVDDVFYASLTTDGNLYVDIRNDNLSYLQKVED